jgi:hypothetical protein
MEEDGIKEQPKDGVALWTDHLRQCAVVVVS